MAGRYLARADWGEAILQLNEDGTFVEEASSKDGRKKRIEGKWEYKNGFTPRQPCLQMDHLMLYDEISDGCNPKPYKYGFNSIAIDIDPDAGFSYAK